MPFPSLALGALYFAAMIAGMLAQATFDAIRRRASGRRPRFDRWRMALPLLVSPMIFGAVAGQLPDGPTVQLAALVLAFQNGFFWHAVLSALAPAGADAAARSAGEQRRERAGDGDGASVRIAKELHGGA